MLQQACLTFKELLNSQQEEFTKCRGLFCWNDKKVLIKFEIVCVRF